ncbi:MAG: gfo/Idh/MocA family oxidoreductase [Actinobacteria bacterium]|nr:gfo/Idh/MocA family oxidoreductase [Actinomycetota bacterium]
MRVVIVGLGVQGRKRYEVAKADVVASVDLVVDGASYRNLEAVPSSNYDAVLLCTPDLAKPELIRYALRHSKHVLVEKPLSIEAEALRQSVVVYTAYNHRFEPHIAKVGELLKTGVIGEPYRCSLFYGNGTARLVRESAWRDCGTGVLHDLGSHNIDIVCEWFGRSVDDYKAALITKYENNSPDHCTFQATCVLPHIQVELSLLSWRNTFRAEIIGSRGSIHVDGLAKWGESTLTLRERVLPSGRPTETIWKVPQGDPTWQLEYAHFLNLCRTGAKTDLERDRLIDRALARISATAVVDARAQGKTR